MAIEFTVMEGSLLQLGKGCVFLEESRPVLGLFWLKNSPTPQYVHVLGRL